MRIVNLRGTSGSGKSTLIKAIMAMGLPQPIRTEGRKQPLGYTLTIGDVKLFIPGHYESACGGCDTLGKYLPGVTTPRLFGEGDDPNSYHLIFGLVRQYASLGYSVLFEGLLISGDVRHTAALHEDGLPLAVVAFDLPIELCIQSVLDRRKAAGNEKPFNEKNTREKHALLARCVEKLKERGVLVHQVQGRDIALSLVKELLGIPLVGQ
jgi:energy-coupling factor transporter ATP-binding protein EcfA2